MAYYLVDIRGDAYRAMGKLAKAGIANVVDQEEPTERVAARVSSDSAEGATRRVRAALGDEFTIGEACQEGGERP
jgi:hypothetical protein